MVFHFLSVISSDLPFIARHVRFITVPFKTFADNDEVDSRYPH